MLLRLLTILFSSWATTPLVLLFAQANHFANIEVIQTILLTLVAQTPLLVLFNECVTPSFIKHDLATPVGLIAGTAIAQAITIYIALIFSGHDAHEPFILIATALATGSSVITLTQSERVNYAALTGKLSYRNSLALGCVPSTILLILYFSYQYLLKPDQHGWLLLHLILPALVYRTISKNLPKPPRKSHHIGRKQILLFAFAALILLAITAINVQVRKDLSVKLPQYSSIILAALNILSSIFLTFSRVNHIKSGATNVATFKYRSIGPAILASIFVAVTPASSSLTITALKFLVLQAALIHALTKLRGIWQEEAHYNTMLMANVQTKE
jgi:hypothetical protein